MDNSQKEDQQPLTQPAPPGYQQVVRGPSPSTQPQQPSAVGTATVGQPQQPMVTMQAFPYSAMVPGGQPAQFVQQPFVPIHAGYPGGMGMVQVPQPRPLLPKEMQPNDYLVISLVVIIVCGFFNVASLFFSVPAIICSILAYEKKSSGYYGVAYKLGLAALILNVVTVTWVMVWGVIITGVVIACAYEVNGFYCD